ncbi:MAG: ATP-binding protein [Geobacteraceae bacterium]|nr:ATP-binding protein [Geobacteraceae bacterium]
MLLRFGVSNFLSINEYQELSMIATPLKDTPSHLCEVSGFREKVLPVIGIYGANASGKTNMLKALRFLINGILYSHQSGRVEGGISRSYFKLNQSCKDKPSKFDCDFIHNNIRYHFGYLVDNECIVEEWLYAYPHGTRQVWYHRKHDEKEMYFGKFLKGKNRVLESLTRINSLYFSVAAQNNNEQLLDLYKYFKDNFIFSFNNFGPVSRSSEYFLNNDFKDKIISFIQHADTGISAVKIDEIEVPDTMKGFTNKLNNLLSEHLGDNKIDIESAVEKKKISFAHTGINGEDVFLNINSESRGTIALIKMLGPVFDSLSSGKTIIIDELDTSMHSLLSRKIVSLFNNCSTNQNCSQLIFTTHDTSILSREVLRRDEIWFTEKKSDGATEIYSLADIKSRQSDNFEKGYLQGRYGGIPFLGNIDDLFGCGGQE